MDSTTVMPAPIVISFRSQATDKRHTHGYATTGKGHMPHGPHNRLVCPTNSVNGGDTRFFFMYVYGGIHSHISDVDVYVSVRESEFRLQ